MKHQSQFLANAYQMESETESTVGGRWQILTAENLFHRKISATCLIKLDISDLKNRIITSLFQVEGLDA